MGESRGPTTRVERRAKLGGFWVFPLTRALQRPTSLSCAYAVGRPKRTLLLFQNPGMSCSWVIGEVQAFATLPCRANSPGHLRWRGRSSIVTLALPNHTTLRVKLLLADVVRDEWSGTSANAPSQPRCAIVQVTPVFTHRQYVLCHRNTTVSKHWKLEPPPLPRLVSSSLGLQAQGCDGHGP